jgi:hypothetical protein
MRNYFAARLRWLRVNWFWPLALLAVPACGLSTDVPRIPTNVEPGERPWKGVAFCDIEVERHCASSTEIGEGLFLTAGARALVAGVHNTLGIDFSAAATARCGGGPEAVTFKDPFPDGTPVCLNCADTEGFDPVLCIEECEDLTDPGVVPPNPVVAANCANRARYSINATTPTFCFEDACTDDGFLLDTFISPRRSPEPVNDWQNTKEVTLSGPDSNTVTKKNTGTNAFDAGAASFSTRHLAGGDGYVEFTAQGLSTRMVGLSAGDDDTSSDYTTIDYGLDLFKDGCVFVFEKGTQIKGPIETCSVPDAFESYASGDKFRITVIDNSDGTATISYMKVNAACETTLNCPAFYTSTVPVPYGIDDPLRLDLSFHDDGAVVQDIVVVRIRQ